MIAGVELRGEQLRESPRRSSRTVASWEASQTRMSLLEGGRALLCSDTPRQRGRGAYPVNGYSNNLPRGPSVARRRAA